MCDQSVSQPLSMGQWAVHPWVSITIWQHEYQRLFPEHLPLFAVRLTRIHRVHGVLPRDGSGVSCGEAEAQESVGFKSTSRMDDKMEASRDRYPNEWRTFGLLGRMKG